MINPSRDVRGKLWKKDGSGFQNILPLHLDAKMPFAFSLLAEQNVTVPCLEELSS